MLSDDSVELFCIKCHYQGHTPLTSPFIYFLAGGFSKIATRALERRCLSVLQSPCSRAKSNFPKSGLSFVGLTKSRPISSTTACSSSTLFNPSIYTHSSKRKLRTLLELLKAHILEHTSELILHASTHIDLINYPRDPALRWPIG
jgi:hypothetical protein